jgi:hypothetical protein
MSIKFCNNFTAPSNSEVPLKSHILALVLDQPVQNVEFAVGGSSSYLDGVTGNKEYVL